MEKIEIFRGTDRLCPATGRFRYAGRRCVPPDRRVRSDVLHLEEKFADLDVTELKRLKTLEDENARLKRIVADLTLDKQILQEDSRKKL